MNGAKTRKEIEKETVKHTAVKPESSNGHAPAEFPPNIAAAYRPAQEQEAARVAEIKGMTEAILSIENMRLRSQITPQLAARLIQAQAFAQHYNSELMQAIVDYVLQTRVSIKGWGMKNLVDSLKSLRSGMYFDEDGHPKGSRNLRQRLLNR